MRACSTQKTGKTRSYPQFGSAAPIVAQRFCGIVLAWARARAWTVIALALPLALDKKVWGIAIGDDPAGRENHFVIYSKRRGFVVESRARTHATLKPLTEANVAAEIALLHRVKITRFERG